MLIAVDHIVARVADLEAAVDTYRRLGFTVSSPDATETAYLLFGDFRLELHRLAGVREGLHTLALSCDEIDAEVARLRDAGFDVTDPVDDPFEKSLSRRTAEVDALVPIRLVDTGYDGEALRALLGDPDPHPNTANTLERTYVAVESIDRELETFERALGLAAPEPEMGTVIMSMMSVFNIGAIGVAVAEPRGPGPTADALATNGPGMFQVLFRAGSLDAAERQMVDHGMPPPSRGTRLSGESALLVTPDIGCGAFVAMAGMA